MADAVPAAVLQGSNPVAQVSSYANLAAAATVVLTLATKFNPLLDLYLFSDQICSVQLAGITQTSGSGSTYRNIDNVMTMVAASTPLIFRGYRVSFVSIQFTVTNTSGTLTTTLEFSALARSF